MSRRPTRPRPTTPPRSALALEVIERTVFHITDRTIARRVRQALAADNVDALDDMLTFVTEFSETCRHMEHSVLTVAEVK